MIKKSWLICHSGFTLLELMIVLMLITLVLGLSAVFFANAMPSSKLNAAAREISATIRYAHQLAQVEGSRKVLDINLDTRQYGIEGRGNKNIDPDIAVTVIDPFAGELRNGTYSVLFQPTGTAQGGTIVLSMAGKTTKQVRIVLDPVMGSVVLK